MISASLIPARMLAASGGEHNVMLPHTYDLVWGTVCFVVIAVALIKYALPRFTAVLDERTSKIEEGLALAQQAKDDSQQAQLQASRLVEDARREAAEIRAKAQDEARAIVAAARTEAAGEAGKALAGAQRQIAADKQAAQVALRAEVGGLATTLATKILGHELSDAAASAQVIDRFLDELDSAPVVAREAR